VIFVMVAPAGTLLPGPTTIPIDNPAVLPTVTAELYWFVDAP
jgi:hypothetical protein